MSNSPNAAMDKFCKAFTSQKRLSRVGHNSFGMFSSVPLPIQKFADLSLACLLLQEIQVCMPHLLKISLL